MTQRKCRSCSRWCKDRIFMPDATSRANLACRPRSARCEMRIDGGKERVTQVASILMARNNLNFLRHSRRTSHISWLLQVVAYAASSMYAWNNIAIYCIPIAWDATMCMPSSLNKFANEMPQVLRFTRHIMIMMFCQEITIIGCFKWDWPWCSRIAMILPSL